MRFVNHRKVLNRAGVPGWRSTRVAIGRTSLFVLAVLWCADAWAAVDPAVFTGSVGRAQIVLQLYVDADRVSGRYFYRRTRQDIPLDGAQADGTLQLTAQVTGDSLTLARAGHRLVGRLVTKAGVSFPVALDPAEPTPASPSARPGTDTPPDGPDELYERFRMQDLRLAVRSRQVISGRTIAWYREDLSQREMFRLEAGYPTPVMDAINPQLETFHLERVQQTLSCTGIDGRTGVEDSHAEAPFLSADYVSFTWVASWSCEGAAHPDFETSARTFDARTGRRLQLEDILWFGRGAPPREETPEWLDYRANVFAPRIVALMTRLHPADMAKPATPDDTCDYSQPDMWTNAGWSIGPGGLVLHVYTYRAQRQCDDPAFAVIPMAVVDALRRSRSRDR